MKVVILAGGMGTRISEESHLRPKPMIEIGGRPILWHILKIYSAYDINDFIICCGYRGYMIKEYFANYFLHMSDVTIDLANNAMEVHHRHAEPWRITLVDTGLNTLTGGRLRRVREYLGDAPFCMTYGDGVADVNINALLDFHRKEKTLATVTGIQPRGRYGALQVEQDRAICFQEKPKENDVWANGGFFVLEPNIIDYIADDHTSFEGEPLERLAQERQLSVFKHLGFWMAMDTLRDKMMLEELWNSGRAPWKVWS